MYRIIRKSTLSSTSSRASEPTRSPRRCRCFFDRASEKVSAIQKKSVQNRYIYAFSSIYVGNLKLFCRSSDREKSDGDSLSTLSMADRGPLRSFYSVIGIGAVTLVVLHVQHAASGGCGADTRFGRDTRRYPTRCVVRSVAKSGASASYRKPPSVSPL